MLLEIDDSKTIGDLQDKFYQCFPKLKIEFFLKKHHWEELSPEKEILPPQTLIGSIRNRHDPNLLEIKSWDKTGAVEKSFYEKLNLNVQVFFKSGRNWIQTGKSDNLTIEALQQKSKHAEQGVLL